MDEPEPSWAVVVPVKGGPLAKTRLDLPVGLRAALADAFARDTVAALVAAPSVREVLVVTSDHDVAAWVPPAGARVVADPGDGLDAAVAAGARAAAVPGVRRVGVVLGDHPALRADEVEDALRAVARHERAVVADADGTGTALLTAPAGTPFGTAFGPGSAAAHASLGYAVVPLTTPGLRVDVDDAASLATATLLGAGAATRAALERASLPGVQATIHRIEDDGSGAALLDDGLEVVLPPGAATTSGLRHLRVGQRVSIELDDAGRAATRVWIVGIGPGETIR
ncbi:2-phospho-L-lactate guanylyltransferase [Oryzobacter terrae]|uniref:2-phospho-L-lactate guanylyltransferase n=1 Tax=Oryzobacter terrae TaxID=1620385 RepID=UPI0036720613